MAGFRFSHDSYKGKPLLGNERSFSLKESSEHWRRELADAYRAGKIVFVLLPQYFQVYVDTGERQYSGTGKSRHTTEVVALASNYDCLPLNMSARPSEGRAMKLSRDAGVLAEYWREFAEYSEYMALVFGDIGTPCILTKSGDKTVGAILRNQDTGGAYVLLPHLDLDREEFQDEQEVQSEDAEVQGEAGIKVVWTSEGKRFGAKLLHCLIGIDRSLRSTVDISPVPEWLDGSAFGLPKADVFSRKLLRVESKLRELESEKERLRSELFEHEKPRRLLYETGRPLEGAILEALELLGFDAVPYRDDESEFDAVFTSEEGRFLGEAEGKDSKPISIEKLRQLEMNIHEDFAREDVGEMAKGVLFGNAFRMQEPAHRGDYFTEKCVSAAIRGGTALVRTPDLFPLVQYLTGRRDAEFARKCRRAIRDAHGKIVQFPGIPKRLSKPTTVSEQ